MIETGNTQYGLNFNGAWSIGTSKRSEWFINSNKDIPIPGKYNPNFYDKPKSTKWPIGKSEREDVASKHKNPPVGSYEVAENIKKNKHPAFSMGLKLNSDTKKSSVGPNTYNPQIVKSSAPSITFGYREETVWGKDGPAPCEYQNNIIDEEQMRRTMDSWKIRKTGFGTSGRKFYHKTIDLGPGQYQHQKEDVHPIPKISFPKSIRDPLSKFEGPGPGQYSPRLTHSRSTGYSIGNKYVPIKTSDVDTPGPGSYQPRKPKSMQNIRIGREGKFDIVSLEQKLKPGPGDYDQNLIPNRVSHLDLENFQSIGTSQRPQIANINIVPGPGKYNSDGKLFDGPKFSMRPKNEKNKISQTPGPGQYDPEEVTEKPNYHYTVPYTPQPGLGRSQRSTPVYSKFQNVGPGSYNVGGNIGGNKFSVGKSQRFKDRELEDVGPAQYKLPDTIGKIPRYLLEQNKESKFMSLQAEEQKIRSVQKNC